MSSKDSELVQPNKPKHPKVFQSKRRAIIRIKKVDAEEYAQEYGYIYQLNPSDVKTLALYGGHQAIVLDREISDFENWTIVSLVEIWS